MNKTFFTSIYLFIAYLLYGLFISQYNVEIVPPQIDKDSTQSKSIYDYKGVINVHSKLSTGTGDIQQIYEAAHNTKLDFIFLTDLNTFPLPFRHQGYYNKVLAFIDGEYSFLDSRFLYLNQKQTTPISNLGQAGAVLSEHLSSPPEKNENSADRPLAVLAHPTKKGFRWQGDYPVGLDGLEIINLKALWQDSWLNKKITFIWSFLLYPFNPELSFLRLFQRAKAENKIWDQLNQDRLRIAFAGSDAESRFNFFQTPLKFPSYEVLFNIVNNHILIPSELTGDYSKDKRKVLNAITSGQFYMSLDMIGNPVGFNFFAQKNSKKIYMGSTYPFSNKIKLNILIPEALNTPHKILLFRDGQRFKTLRELKNSLTIEQPGTYRAVVYVKISLPFPEGRKWFPWIFTNAIRFE